MSKLLNIFAVLMLLAPSVHAVLVAQYTFDNPSNLGDDIQDVAEGTLTGSPGVSAVNDAERGAVAQFSGGGSGYIHSSLTLPGGGFTLMAWVKSDSWNNNRGVFQVQPGSGATVSSSTKVVGAWVSSSGVAWGRVIDTSGAKTMTVAGPSLTTGTSAEWHHLAYRGNGSTYQVFVDGVAVTDNPVSYNGNLASHESLIIGRQGNEAWLGLMDDFRVYDNALSDAEIAAIAIPEPSAVVLLVACGAGLVLRRRRI